MHSFHHKLSHFITNKVISSQPIPYFKSKHLFYKIFLIFLIASVNEIRVNLVINKAISSQPVPDLKSKHLFYKSFLLFLIEAENCF